MSRVMLMGHVVGSSMGRALKSVRGVAMRWNHDIVVWYIRWRDETMTRWSHHRSLVGTWTHVIRARLRCGGTMGWAHVTTRTRH